MPVAFREASLRWTPQCWHAWRRHWCTKVWSTSGCLRGKITVGCESDRLLSSLDGYSLLMYFWYTISCWGRIELIQARHAIFWSSSFQRTSTIQNKVLRSFQMSEVPKAPMLGDIEMWETPRNTTQSPEPDSSSQPEELLFQKGVYKISDLTPSKLFYISSSLLWQLQKSSDHFLRLSNGNSSYDWPPAAGVPPVMPSAVLCCVMPAG